MKSRPKNCCRDYFIDSGAFIVLMRTIQNFVVFYWKGRATASQSCAVSCPQRTT
ncbi:hypothetical protein PAXRUDRAFT_643916 [Paxillus rubicundulus Ve08.2h10]|uniref:Uncharacterized protein n=1 Tax=Paxillus rubicundulus Ve08.2h10 TaxID=930991 RepID=A0A0D0E2P9_9AGAM|nr:hypothetical protein PAXRUDRAFT_643916 [Paxillus rubicundulus Ve08.2h10]